MKSTVDLYPKEHFAYVAVRRRIVLWSALFTVVTAAVLLASFALWREVRKTEHDLGLLEARVQDMELWGAELEPLVLELESARDRQRILRELVNEPDWNDLLNALGDACVSGVWLRDFTVVREQLRDDSGEPRWIHTIQLTGVAESSDKYIAFMSALSNSPLIAGLDQEFARKSTEFDDPDILEFALRGMVS